MMIDSLREMMHQLAGLLVWPVLIGLILLFVFAALSLGAFLRQLWQRSRRSSNMRSAIETRLAQLATEHGDDPDLDLRLEEALQQHDHWRMKSLQRLRLAVRLGPSLGLMGTLIPMADALQGLADGNLPRLASNMVTAFAATVVGLTISVVAYWISSTRESWAREESRAAAFAAERILRRIQQHNSGNTQSLACSPTAEGESA